jgi:hypothetical protein
MSVDATDNRLPEGRHQREQLNEKVAAPVPLEFGHASIEAGEVGPGAKYPVAGAGQHDHANVSFLLAPAKRGGQLPQHGR